MSWMFYLAIAILMLIILLAAGYWQWNNITAQWSNLTGTSSTNTSESSNANVGGSGGGFFGFFGQNSPNAAGTTVTQQTGYGGTIRRPSDGGGGFSSTQVIIKEVPQACPNPPACKCPECPDCKCPECPDCNCPVTDAELKSSKAELEYLKWMVRFLGALLRRENAVNRVMSQHCPGTFAMVPTVQQVDQETQFVQNYIRKDAGMLNYFQQHFTKYSGIKSKMYKEIL